VTQCPCCNDSPATYRCPKSCSSVICIRCYTGISGLMHGQSFTEQAAFTVGLEAVRLAEPPMQPGPARSCFRAAHQQPLRRLNCQAAMACLAWHREEKTRPNDLRAIAAYRTVGPWYQTLTSVVHSYMYRQSAWEPLLAGQARAYWILRLTHLHYSTEYLADLRSESGTDFIASGRSSN
jgi:hypothetical protein